MLVLEINDARLEHKILEKARSIGKSVQELLKDIVTEKMQTEELNSTTLSFDVPKLDYRQYIRIYEPEIEITENSDDNDVQPFSHVTDTVEYARQLRKDAWNRK